MIEVKRKQHESVSAFLRRFSRRVQQSGMILRTRKRRYYEPAKNKRAVRLSALYREEMKKEIEQKRKLGKISAFDKFSKFSRR